jgi:serine/threonine protein kinase
MIENLGHYKILDRLGAGGLGEIFRARDTRLGRTVAIKVPAADLQAAGTRRRALLDDARAATALSHPNIAALYEIGDDEGRIFFVFEFVPGEPLKHVIAGHPLNVRRAVDLATQVADALAEAHAVNIVHRDLTPGVIMVTPKGNAKILDFGFARWTKTSQTANEADHRVDIAALGAVLFEMLMGKPPAAGAAALGPSLPRELDAVVSKALGTRVDGGYEVAATLAAELRSVAAILDVRAAAADPARVMPLRRVRRSRGMWGVLAAIVVAVALALTAAALWFR